MARRFAVLDAPSNLGLRPPALGVVPGVYKLAGALRDTGLVAEVGARDAGVVVPPRYYPEWDRKSVRNGEAIAGYSARLAARVCDLVDAGQFPVVLGGDCSILLGNMLGLRRRGRYGLVFVDAHSDFRHLGNSKSVGAAAGEDLALVTGHGADELVAPDGVAPLVDPQDVCVVGVRARDTYLDELREVGMEVYTAPRVLELGAPVVAGAVVELMHQRGSVDGLWIHLDLDVVDRAVLPAVDSPEPGGLALTDVSELLGPLIESPGATGLEVTIFDPDLDESGALASAVGGGIGGGSPSRGMSERGPILLYGSTIRSPELRHEVPLAIVDPFLFLEADGRRVAVVGELELPRVENVDGVEALSTESLGIRELRGQMPQDQAAFEVVRRACRELGVSQAVVPGDFPLGLARFLEDAGIALEPRDEVFTERRRRKSGAELEGIRAAQRAANAAMARVRELLSAADATGDVVELDGAPLSSEVLRTVILDVIRAHDTDLDELIVSHGAQTAIGHEPGFGVILPGEPIIVDIWPRDRASGCHTDMTRTFVCGEPPDELMRLHALCLEAMDLALGLIEPGAPTFAVYAAVCELFEQHGFWTPLAQDVQRPDTLSGFPYALGHGVGLELHEQPGLARGFESTFVTGEVLAVEPALYVGGFGGCRLEDAVLVGEDGCTPLTRFSYDIRC